MNRALESQLHGHCLIQRELENGSKKAFVAGRYKESEPTLFNRLRKNKVEIKPE